MKRYWWLAFIILLLTVAPTTAQVFDNSGEGSWKEYFSFPITVTPAEYAQYKIVINGTTWELYNVTGSLEVSGTNSNFWSLVNSTGADIRVFNQSDQLYFWIEKWDYANQTAVIWVNLTAGSTELNIAYGNPIALPSSYNNPKQTFLLFDDFNDGVLDSMWTKKHFGVDTGGTYSVTETNGELQIYASDDTSGDGALVYGVEAKLPNIDNIVVEFRRYSSVLTTYRETSVYVIAQSGFIKHAQNENGNAMIVNDGSTSTRGADVGDGTSYAVYKLVFDGISAKFYVDGVFKYEITTTLPTTPFTTLQLEAASWGVGTSVTNYIDWIRVMKFADPVDFGTPIVKLFQKQFGTKTVYVNVTYLDTATTNRYNPIAYYKLEDKPQINVTSQLSVSGVNATYGANISIELIDFVTLDKVVYNGTDITANLTYQGTITNSTTGYTYNVYNFTTYENGTLEIYGHVSNKAYETVYKLDGATVDIFNVTAVLGEPLEILLPCRGNITIASQEFTYVTSVTVNTKDLGTGAKTITVTIDDPENFTVGYKYGTINIAWGSVNLNITDIDSKPFTATFGIFNRNYSILSTDPSKLYAGDNEISIYFHGVKLKEVAVYLNHTNNGLMLNVTVNATQFNDYRNITRIIASPNAFGVENLSAEYPFSVMKIVNASGEVVVDFTSNPPTAVKVEGATSYSYEKPVLKIVASGNVTITDLYRLTVTIKDRLGNPVNFYVLVNGSRVDASNGKASKLLKPSWYKVEAPVSVSGFELWKFNNSSNIALVEVNTSDVTLPTAEYRVPTKIETKEVRIQKAFPWLPFPIPFLGEAKPKQEEAPVVRLEGTVRDFYNAPVPNRTVKIEVASANYTRIYNVTTDESGNFKIEVDMARGVEYKVTYKFAGDDVYVGSSTTKTFMVEQLLPAPPAPITTEEILIFVAIAVGAIAVVGGIIYLARRTKAQARARMESEFRFFRRLR